MRSTAQGASSREMDDLVRVSVAENEIEAELALALLRTEGIEAASQRSASSTAGWGSGSVSGVGGPFAILVREEDAERAHELLNAPQEPADPTA